MAILNKDGGLSGPIGNFVFVQSGGRTIVRSRPDNVRQTQRTKSAATVFGVVSQREKVYRNAMLRAVGFPAFQHFAARHRARILKTVLHDAGSVLEGKPRFGSPEALTGFDFNPALPWSNCTNFFPVIHKTGGGGLMVELPEIRWREHLKPPRKATGAVVTLAAVAVDFNHDSGKIKTADTLVLDFARGTVHGPQDWKIEAEGTGGWLLVACAIHFKGTAAEKAGQYSGTYLWAGEDVLDD